MKTERLCLFYVGKSHLLVIMNEYLKNKEEYELITFIEDEIKDDLSEPKLYEAAGLDGIIDFKITKEPKEKQIKNTKNEIIVVEGSDKYREKVNTYVQEKTNELNIKNLKIINIYSFEENKLRMSQIFKKNEKILYTIGEEKIEQ